MLRLDTDAMVLVWESVISRDEERVGIALEFLPTGEHLSDLCPVLASEFDSRKRPTATMLSTVTSITGHRFTQSRCEVTAGIVGATRGRILGLRPADPILIMTQVVFLSEKPLYLAKYIVSAKAGHLPLIQTTQS
jgi:GntR family transcriptional regulator